MRIFTKLFLLIGTVSAVPIALGVLAVDGQSVALDRDLVHVSGEVSQRAVAKAATALQAQAEKAHVQIVREKAAEVVASFAFLRAAVDLEVDLTRAALTSEPVAAAPPRWPVEEVVRRLEDPASDFSTRVARREPYSIYHLAPGVEEARVLGTLDRMRTLGVFFAYALREVPGCITTYIGHEDGIMFGYPGETRFRPDYDPRTRPWYRRAAEERRVIWSDPYLDRNGRDRVITCAAPVTLPGRPAPVAVAAIDVRLSRLIQRLLDLPGLQATEALLVDGQGRIVVSRADLDADAPGAPTPTAGTGLASLDSFHGGRFLPVMEAIRRKEAAGASEGFIEGALAVCVFAGFALPGDEGRGPEARWHFIVEERVEDIVNPVKAQEEAIRGELTPLALAVHERLATLGRQVLLVGAAVLGLSVVVAFASARATTRPLLEVAEVAHRVGAGDLAQKVTVRSSDEIGRMGAAINEMIVGLRERELVKSTFKRYVAATVVDDLLRTPDKIKLGGEKREMTVFFCDLAGFTTVSETLTPEELVEVMNEYLGGMTETILALEGTVDKYIGDAVMAFWGAPAAQPDHALRACKAALRGQAKLEELARGWERRGIRGVEVRAGINTGVMVVGNMGGPTQMSYTVMGDAVNLGSRLEGTNKLYGTRVLITEATRAAAGPSIVTREVDAIAVKGKRQAVRVHEVCGLAGDVPEPRLAGYRAFEEGLAAYRARRWDEADAAFARADAALGGGDGPSRVLRERIARFREAPPPEGWDGTYVATEK